MGLAATLNVILSLAGPWLTGTIMARFFLGVARPSSLYAGHGFLLGYITVIAWLRLFDAAGIALYFWPVMAAVLLTGAAFALPVWHEDTRKKSGLHPSRYKHMQVTVTLLWQWILLLLLAALTLLQLKFIHDEVLLRPTFPWDAWRGWEPETLQHLESRSLSATLQTVGNYGNIASQVHLWTMLATGSGKAPITHIPWLFAYVAIGLVIFGQMRLRHGFLPSAIGGFALLSLPYLSIHAALAGYADIWLMLAFTLGVFSLALAGEKNRARLFMLFGIYLTTTLLSKRAGIPMSVSLVACLIFSLIRWTPARVAVVASIPIILGALIAAIMQGYISLQATLPLLGDIDLNKDYIRLPFVMRYSFELSFNLWPFVEALFLFGNWHLVTALFVVCIVTLILKQERDASLALPLLGWFSSLILIGGFFLTLSPASAADQTALSRALLYVVPLMIYTAMSVTSLSFANIEIRRHNKA